MQEYTRDLEGGPRYRVMPGDHTGEYMVVDFLRDLVVSKHRDQYRADRAAATMNAVGGECDRTRFNDPCASHDAGGESKS